MIRYAWRALLVIAVFLGVGFAAMYLVTTRLSQAGTPVPELRLAGAMAGLFAGGAAASLAGIVMVWKRRPPV